MIATHRTLPLCLLIATLTYASFFRSIAAPQKEHGGAKPAAAKPAAAKPAAAKPAAAKPAAAKPAAAKPAAAKPAVAEEDLPVVEDNKFTIEVTSKTDNVAGGQPIQIDITLKNNGASKPRMLNYPVENFFDIEVTGPYPGDPTPRLPSADFRRYGGSFSSFELSNGRTISGWVMLSNIYDMTLKGTYTVRVSKRFRFLDARKAPVVIRSNPLILKVASNVPVSSWYGLSKKQ